MMTTMWKALAIGAALILAMPAQAARQFNFTVDAALNNGDAISASGVLTTDDGTAITPSTMRYDILGVTGSGKYNWMTGSAAITGLMTGETGWLKQSSGFFSIGALPLAFDGTPGFFQIVSTPTGTNGRGVDGVYAANVRFTLSPLVTAVPEPASWALMIGGIGMVGALVRRRRVMAVVAA